MLKTCMENYLIKIVNFQRDYQGDYDFFQVHKVGRSRTTSYNLSNHNLIDVPNKRLKLLGGIRDGKYPVFLTGQMALRLDAMGRLGEWDCV